MNSESVFKVLLVIIISVSIPLWRIIYTNHMIICEKAATVPTSDGIVSPGSVTVPGSVDDEHKNKKYATTAASSTAVKSGTFQSTETPLTAVGTAAGTAAKTAAATTAGTAAGTGTATKWCPSLLKDFVYPSVTFAVIFVLLRHLFVWLSAPLAKYMVRSGKRIGPALYQERLVRFSHNIFNSIYFLIVVYFAYNLLHEQQYFPVELGGQVSVAASYDSYYRHDNKPIKREHASILQFSVDQSDLISPAVLPFVKHYFLLSAGFHLMNLSFLIVGANNAEQRSCAVGTWETVVQVTLALQLIFYGFMTKHLAAGTCLLFMHDLCDILASACKALVHTTWKVSTFMLATVLILAWWYLRLYCLAKLIMLPLLRKVEELMPWSNGNSEPVLFTVLLLSLYFMNIYWFACMIKSAVIFVNSGRITDMHCPEQQQQQKQQLLHEIRGTTDSQSSKRKKNN